MSEPNVLWTSDGFSSNGWQYRITQRDDDNWFAKARLMRMLRLERRRSSFDSWYQVGSGVDYLKWPPRTGVKDGKPYTWHSRRSAIAHLQGYAAAQKD